MMGDILCYCSRLFFILQGESANLSVFRLRNRKNCGILWFLKTNCEKSSAMKRVFVCLTAAALAVSLSGCGSAAGQEQSAASEIFAMDTVMKLTARGENGEAAVSAAVSAIQSLDRALDRTAPSSQVSAINAGAGTAVEAGGQVLSLVCAALEYGTATGGAFDITVAPVMDAWGFTSEEKQVPPQEVLDRLLPLVDSGLVTVDGETVALAEGQAMDLGGIAKGYASDCAEEALRQAGAADGVIWLGGNVYVQGSSPDGDPWQIGIQDPRGDDSFALLRLTDAYAITSGGYQRYFEQDGRIYHHIIDPATGYPADSGLLSVTVVADANGPGRSPDGYCLPGSGTMCDAFSTALFVMGEERAVRFWKNGGYDFDMVLVTDDGRVLITDGLAENFEGNEALDYTYEVIR